MAHDERLSVQNVDPKATQAVLGLERYVHASGLDGRLYELVKIRASQINGCAYCLDMHHRDARAAGEDQRRLDVLSAWREAPDLFTAEERAALSLTESVTLIAEGGRSGRRVSRGERPVRRGRHRAPAHGHRRHQRVEPARDQHPSAAARRAGERDGRLKPAPIPSVARPGRSGPPCPTPTRMPGRRGPPSLRRRDDRSPACRAEAPPRRSRPVGTSSACR
jgi:AhpD family alkylhydroperoxidase